MSTSYISIERIITDVQREFPWTNEVDLLNVVEIVGESLDLLGVHKNYVTKITDGNKELGHVCPVEISKYRGKLPDNIVSITQIAETSTGAILRASTDSFHINLVASEAGIETPSLNPFGQQSTAFSSPLMAVQSKLKDINSTNLTYTINGCYIFTNFESGSLIVVYKALPTDDRGFPVIPNHTKTITALKWCVAEKIAMKLFLVDKLTKQKFDYVSQQRDWYVAAAINSKMIPTVDEMESLKDSWVRLIPNINAHSSGFKYQNQQEQINL